MMPRVRLLWGCGCVPALLLVMSLCSCGTLQNPTVGLSTPPPKVRFLITFDDGPSAREDFNPTLAILNHLATNDVQPHVCAVFFTQPVHPRGGGTPKGREVMRQIHAQGHILGIHSVSPKGHVAHHTVPTNELVACLLNARNILNDIAGAETLLVRPPYGTHTPTTRQIYAQLGLHLLLADIRARDGIIFGYTGSLTRRWHIRSALAALKEKLEQQPAGDTPQPIVMQFHDLNPYTARHMTEYLHILVEEARRVGLALPDKPFFCTRQEALAAALQRSLPPPESRAVSQGLEREPVVFSKPWKNLVVTFPSLGKHSPVCGQPVPTDAGLFAHLTTPARNVSYAAVPADGDDTF